MPRTTEDPPTELERWLDSAEDNPKSSPEEIPDKPTGRQRYKRRAEREDDKSYTIDFSLYATEYFGEDDYDDYESLSDSDES